jgi:hypothetical protein
MRRERRKNFRIEWNSPACLYDRNGRFGRACVVSNLSNGGARIVIAQPETVSDVCVLRITPHSPLRKCHVIWRTKEAIGVQFAETPRRVRSAMPRAAAAVPAL